MWEPQPASSPPPGWWIEMRAAAEERELRRWADAVVTEVRARRIARRRAVVDEVDTALAHAGLPADRRAQFDRGFEASVRSRDGEAESWRPGEIEYSRHVGRC
jgi:hypothetical protein